MSSPEPIPTMRVPVHIMHQGNQRRAEVIRGISMGAAGGSRQKKIAIPFVGRSKEANSAGKTAKKK